MPVRRPSPFARPPIHWTKPSRRPRAVTHDKQYEQIRFPDAIRLPGWVFFCDADATWPRLLYSLVNNRGLFSVSVIANNVNWGVNGIEGDTDLNDLQDTVKKKLGSFGAEIPDFDQLNRSSLPAVDEGERVLREKCLKNSQRNDSYETTVVGTR